MKLLENFDCDNSISNYILIVINYCRHNFFFCFFFVTLYYCQKFLTGTGQLGIFDLRGCETSCTVCNVKHFVRSLRD